MNKKHFSGSVILPLSIIEGVLYSVYMMMDIGVLDATFLGLNSNIFKYISICFLLVSSLILFIKFRNRYNSILVPALVFTVIADYFLLFTNNLIPGIISFCIVQQLYLLLIFQWSRTDFHINLFIRDILIRVLFATCLFITLYFLTDTDAFSSNFGIFIICSFYGTCFILNIIEAFLRHSPLLFKIGMVLFFLCDVCVLFTNIPEFFSVNDSFGYFCTTVTSILMWTFYLPGKYLIFLSVFGYKNK